LRCEFLIDFVNNSLKDLKKYKEKIENEFNMPLSEDDISDMLEDEIYKAILDSISYRFLKIQSTIGEKLFKEVLEEIGISTLNKSFVQILSEIEREGIISVDEWKELRVIRNSLSHDYPEELAEITLAINEILNKIDFFETIIKKIQKLCSQKKK
jgi:hypothetical protein